MTDFILDCMRRFIPTSPLSFRSSHPWLTPECLAAVERKHVTAGTADFPSVCRACSDTLLRAHEAFIHRTRAQLRNLRCGKKCWLLSDSLLCRKAKTGISPLRRSNGTWAISAAAKAELFAEAFPRKWRLPEPETNMFSDLDEVLAPPDSMDFCRIRTRSAKAVLASLRADSGTGPDLVPARVLRTCARELSRPTALLARQIIAQSRWPELWCRHWIHPLHKRKAVTDADNYRGLQLTAQLSKVIERLVGQLFIPRLERVGAYGPNQFAYRKERGARDAVLFFVLSWLHAFGLSFRVALYLSDVSGAFDRVKADRLVAKLRAFSVPAPLLALLSSWLRPRRASVVVSGAVFSQIDMCNMVFQGTVWGPVLWNVFFADACMAR